MSRLGANAVYHSHLLGPLPHHQTYLNFHPQRAQEPSPNCLELLYAGQPSLLVFVFSTGLFDLD
jgi:hypothetical protein